MSASGSRKKVMLLTVVPDELHTPLTAAILSSFFFTPQSKEVQMDNAGGDNPGNNDVAVTTTPIQMIKTLKIYKPNLYYSDWDKLKG